MKIYKHRPNLVFDHHPLTQKKLIKLFQDENINKLSSGKACIIRILDLWGIKGKNIIVPYYICSDVVSAIEYSGNSVIYCDIDIEDMNISFNSVHDICKKNKISVVLAPSLYGNSANLSKLSSFCKSKKIKLLNDCAQSCGATLHNKSLLMYGDAAFISVSIGKPLSGFAGAYMSIKGKKLNQKDFTNTSNIYYLLITCSYIFSRVLIEWKAFRIIGKFFSKLSELWVNYAHISVYDMYIPIWVNWYNMKLIAAQLDLAFQFRQDFIDLIIDTKDYRVIRSIRGKPVGFRLILLFFEKETCRRFSTYLMNNEIYYSNGYNIRSFQFDSARIIDERIIDLPIDHNKKKRKYLKDVLDRYG
jgi:hypothetical protein